MSRSPKIKKNNKKPCKKQNYLCKDCGRQFIGNHALSHIRRMVFGFDTEDLTNACTGDWHQGYSNNRIGKHWNSNKIIMPKRSHCQTLEADEFWTYAGDKKRTNHLKTFDSAFFYINFGCI